MTSAPPRAVISIGSCASGWRRKAARWRCWPRPPPASPGPKPTVRCENNFRRGCGTERLPRKRGAGAGRTGAGSCRLMCGVFMACGRAQPHWWRWSGMHGLSMRVAFKIQTFVMKLPASGAVAGARRGGFSADARRDGPAACPVLISPRAVSAPDLWVRPILRFQCVRQNRGRARPWRQSRFRSCRWATQLPRLCALQTRLAVVQNFSGPPATTAPFSFCARR